MKKITAVLALVCIAGFGNAQVGPYAWFNKGKIPYYRARDRNFDTYISQGGVERNGFTPGYYLDKEGNKIEGEVQYNFPFIMERILVFRSDGRTSFINPRDIKGYFVDGIYRESVTINASMLGGESKLLQTYFMIPEIQGKLSLYHYTGEDLTSLTQEDNNLAQWDNYYEAYSVYLRKEEHEIQIQTPKTYYIQKQGEPATGVEAMSLTFANKMSKMVSDCAALAEKVKAKEKGYRSQNLENVIKEYNDCQ